MVVWSPDLEERLNTSPKVLPLTFALRRCRTALLRSYNRVAMSFFSAGLIERTGMIDWGQTLDKEH